VKGARQPSILEPKRALSKNQNQNQSSNIKSPGPGTSPYKKVEGIEQVQEDDLPPCTGHVLVHCFALFMALVLLVSDV